MAWLDATPDGAKESRRKSYNDAPITKLQPDEFCSWLVMHVIECGLSVSNGFGLASISWSEIIAWQEATCNRGLWIASTVKLLSVAYTSEIINAKDITRGSPLSLNVDIKEQRIAVANQIKNIR